MRYMRHLPPEAWSEARHQVKLRKCHWYVRQQAAMLLALKRLSPRELSSVEEMYDKEQNPEVKRTLLQALTQLPRKQLGEIVRQLLFVADPKLQRVGRFYYGTLFDRNKGLEQIKSIVGDFREETLLERFYEIEVLSKAKDPGVRGRLLDELIRRRREVHRPLLQTRVRQTIEGLRVATANADIKNNR
jgi:hypothetical protein